MEHFQNWTKAFNQILKVVVFISWTVSVAPLLLMTHSYVNIMWLPEAIKTFLGPMNTVAFSSLPFIPFFQDRNVVLFSNLRTVPGVHEDTIKGGEID